MKRPFSISARVTDKRVQSEQFFETGSVFLFFLGRRKCLGETVAKVEIFIFFANLIKTFKVENPDRDGPPPSMDPAPGLTIGPMPFKVKFSVRG